MEKFSVDLDKVLDDFEQQQDDDDDLPLLEDPQAYRPTMVSTDASCCDGRSKPDLLAMKDTDSYFDTGQPPGHSSPERISLPDVTADTQVAAPVSPSGSDTAESPSFNLLHSSERGDRMEDLLNFASPQKDPRAPNVNVMPLAGEILSATRGETFSFPSCSLGEGNLASSLEKCDTENPSCDKESSVLCDIPSLAEVEVKPVGFSIPQDSSDAELKSYLEELEVEMGQNRLSENEVTSTPDLQSTEMPAPHCLTHESVDASHDVSSLETAKMEDSSETESNATEVAEIACEDSLSIEHSNTSRDPTPEETREATEDSTTASPDETETAVDEQPLLPPRPTSLSIPTMEASGRPGHTPVNPLPPMNPEELVLGREPPYWVPDSDAPNCMLCDLKFTMIKRRHHCRACGKVLCAPCCSAKAPLPYMDNKEARVCEPCLEVLNRAEVYRANLNAGGGNYPSGRSPNPNNPLEYCSTVPPLEQASSSVRSSPPTVMVPVGVLKREGSSNKSRGSPKQVMFSDGIRPGGDLTELDGSSESRRGPASSRRPARLIKKVEREEFTLEENPDVSKLLPALRDENAPSVVFAINRSLFVSLKILILDCCVGRTVWCFATRGLCTVGQDELIILLDVRPDEQTPPLDIFQHIASVYQEAAKGHLVGNMGHTLFSGPFLGSREHGGFLYIRPTFQCLQKLPLPPAGIPYLVAVLLQKWETPWAKVFPMRLMLRLGAEYRYYPCPLVCTRDRKPVFGEIGHTIMNVLADFRNFQYMLPTIPGMFIHMEDKQTVIGIPKNHYKAVMRALGPAGANEHVLALGATFSSKADSHLVCIQNEHGNYVTQAINIQNRPLKVTGASFVVFNGALKAASGLSAKSSMVEDGVMVQVPPDTMASLRSALTDMADFEIGCGPAKADSPDQLVLIQWVDDDRNYNVGVKSPVDGSPLDGVHSIKIHTGTDYLGDTRLIRWTEVFLLKMDEEKSGEPADFTKVSDSLARAFCIALTPHLDNMASQGHYRLGLRAFIDPDNVGYEVGSSGTRLPDPLLNSLDTELIPVIHQAANSNRDNGLLLELIFYIVEH